MKLQTRFMLDWLRSHIGEFARAEDGLVSLRGTGSTPPPDPENPPPNDGTDGTITITRGPLGCVGEAVYFEVENVTGFPLTTGSFIRFDPVFHEIEWKWTITPPSGSEPTTWVAPTRNITANKNRLRHWGKWGFFTPMVQDGTYTIAVEGRHRPSGRVVNLSTTFDVVTQISVATRVLIVYDGSNLTGAPAHSAGDRYTSFKAAHSAARGINGTVLISFLGGYASSETFSNEVRDTDAVDHIIVNTYGTGKGRINISGGSGNRRFMWFRAGWNGGFVWQNVEIEGTWDMTAGLSGSTEGAYGDGFYFAGSPWFSMSGAGPSKMGTLMVSTAGAQSVFVEDVVMRHYLDYRCFNYDAARLMFRGCDMDNPPNATVGFLDNDSSSFNQPRNQHTSIRTGNMNRLLISGCTFLTNVGWSGLINNNWASHQPAWRYKESTGDGGPGGNIIVERCLCEGNAPIGGQSDRAHNGLFERNMILGTTQGSGLGGSCRASGTTARLNFFLGSSADRDPSASPRSGGGEYQFKIGRDISPVIGGVDNTDPVRIYCNLAYDPAAEDYQSWACGFINLSTSPLAVVANNLAYAPNYTTPVAPDGALSPRTGVTVANTVGSRLGFTHHRVDFGTANIGDTKGPFPWFNDLDGNPVDGDTFSGGPGWHIIHNSAGATTNWWRVSLNDLGNGTFTITFLAENAGGYPVTYGNHRLQLDRRHDIVTVPGTASIADDGRIWAPDSIVPATGQWVTYWDFFENVREATTCVGPIAVEAE